MVVAPSGSSDFIHKDTILLDVGIVDVRFIEHDIRDGRLEFSLNVNFQMNKQIIPIKSHYVLSNYEDEWLSALISVDSKYFPKPVMSYDELPKEYHFLDSYFLNDNYMMSLSEDEKSWICKGLNRSAEEIILTRIGK